MRRALIGATFGAVAGFLTRPCCAIPAAMSLAGLSSSGLGQVAVTFRPALISVGIVMLTGALWMTFRREGGFHSKVFAACATMVGFMLSLRALGVF